MIKRVVEKQGTNTLRDVYANDITGGETAI
jgi:hypothetical protein